jgi:O-Antigen ligase
VSPAATIADDRVPVLSRRLERLLCILVVAAAVKAPLGIPLYLNSVLLLLGVFSLIVLQGVPRLFLWNLALVALGTLSAWRLGILADSGPRLMQLFLTLLATALIMRLDPELLGRYLALLLPLSLLVLAAEPLLPEAIYKARVVFGVGISRQGGLHGEPNYNAMLYGVVGMILAQQRPRWLGIPPLLAAAPSLSRGLVAAIVSWLGAKAVGRRAVWLAPLAAVVLCAQPLIVLAVDDVIGPDTRQQLNRLTSNRYMIWAAHAEAGAQAPLGVGYFNAEAVITRFDSPAGRADRLIQTGPQSHSVFLQVLGEFGWVGYLLFVGFVLHLNLIVARFAPRQLPLLLFILTGYAFLNGLTDWPFWVGIGYVLAHTRPAPQAASP